MQELAAENRRLQAQLSRLTDEAARNDAVLRNLVIKRVSGSFSNAREERSQRELRQVGARWRSWRSLASGKHHVQGRVARTRSPASERATRVWSRAALGSRAAARGRIGAAQAALGWLDDERDTLVATAQENDP